MTPGERAQRPEKGEWNDGEFESFLAEIAPTLEQSVGRLGVAGSLDTRASFIDPEKLIMAWPEIADRIAVDQRLLRLPLVRSGQLLSVGTDADVWKQMVEAERTS